MIPLPAHKYVPGRTARHPEGAFDAIRAEAAAAPGNRAWRYGLSLFNAGFWWECHEVLEAVWLAAPPNSAEKAAVQAVIQLANAALKVEMDRPKAAARLCDMAESLAAEATRFAGAPMDLNMDRFSESVAKVRSGRAKLVI